MIPGCSWITLPTIAATFRRVRRTRWARRGAYVTGGVLGCGGAAKLGAVVWDAWEEGERAAQAATPFWIGGPLYEVAAAPVAVPEPTTVVVFGLGLAVLAVARGRR